MSVRELVVLGTSSQVPTRLRNHNGYFLRWDAEGILFDPGEGTQRQMAHAGVAATDLTRMCITHFHGDHCLGVPGVVQRLSLDRVAHRTAVFAFPIWTFAVIAGAIWAESAWGRFWGWDPKETWSFIAWVVYAAYLHARTTAGWRGRPAAWVNVAGLVVMMFNLLYVNMVSTGLHSYAGVN